MTTNSSPPSRATVSDSRTALVSRCAIACSSWSPASWPSVSLMRLKWSKSRNRHATCVPSRCACARICRSRWLSSDAVRQPGEDVVLRELVGLRGGDLELARALRDLLLERALVVRHLGLRLGQPLRHVVERVREQAELVGRSGRHVDVEASGADGARRAHQPPHGRHELAREDQRGDHRDHDQQAHDADGAQHLLAELPALIS